MVDFGSEGIRLDDDDQTMPVVLMPFFLNIWIKQNMAVGLPCFSIFFSLIEQLLLNFI
jgi:hypothetical protein